MEQRGQNISSQLGACGGKSDAALDTAEAQAQSDDSNNSLGSNIQTSLSEANLTRQSFPFPAVDDSEICRLEPMMVIIDKIAIGERVPPQIAMRYEILRFTTLRSFPRENKPSIIRIAQAGFYYANSSDEVVCYCCAKRKRNWIETDVPLDVHHQLSPHCSFFKRNHEVNVRTTKLPNLASYNKSTSGLAAAPKSALLANQIIDSSRKMDCNTKNSQVTSFNNPMNSIPETSTALSQPTAQVTSLARPNDVVSSNNHSQRSSSQPYVRTAATTAKNTGVLKGKKTTNVSFIC